MKIDILDINILRHLYTVDHSTTTGIAKALFEIENKNDLVAKDNRIRHRVKTFVTNEIVTATNSKPTMYCINKAKVHFGDCTLSIATNNGNKFEMYMGEHIVVVGPDDQVIIYPLEPMGDDEDVMINGESPEKEK